MSTKKRDGDEFVCAVYLLGCFFTVVGCVVEWGLPGLIFALAGSFIFAGLVTQWGQR